MVDNTDTQKLMEGCCWQWELQGSGTDGLGAQSFIQRNPLCLRSVPHMECGFGLLSRRCVSNHRSDTPACRQSSWISGDRLIGQCIIEYHNNSCGAKLSTAQPSST